MSNHFLGNFYQNESEEEHLSDFDVDEDDQSEPEPQFGFKSMKENQQQISIDVDQEEQEEEKKKKKNSMPRLSPFPSNSNVKSTINSSKENESTLKYSLLGDFQLINIIHCEEHILSCLFSRTDEIIAVGLSNGTIQIYSKLGQLQYVLNDNETKCRRLPVTSMKFFGDKENPRGDHSKMIVASYANGLVKLWFYPNQQCVLTFDEKPRQCLALDLNCLFNKLFVAGSDMIINGYDLTTKKLIHQYKSSSMNDEMTGHKNRIHALRCHPEEESIYLTGGWDQTIHYWDQRIQYSQKHFSGPFICGDSLDISSQHQTILTGSWRKSSTLQIWDYSTGQLIKDPFENNSPSMLYSTKYSSKDSILCGGNDLNQALIYDYSNFKIIGGIINLENAVYSADIDPNRSHLIVGSEKNLFLLQSKSSIKDK